MPLTRATLFVALGVVTIGCHRGGPAKIGAEDVLMRAAGQPVMLSEIQQELDLMPAPVRQRYETSAEDRRELFNRIVNNEILTAEAVRLGYDKAPDVVRATKQALVLKLVRERLGTAPSAGAVSPAAIQAYYSTHAQDFDNRPLAEVKVKISHLLTDQERDRKVDGLVSELRRELDVQVFDQNLSRLTFAAKPDEAHSEAMQPAANVTLTAGRL